MRKRKVNYTGGYRTTMSSVYDRRRRKKANLPPTIVVDKRETSSPYVPTGVRGKLVLKK